MAKVRSGRPLGLTAALVALALLGGGMAQAHQARLGAGTAEAATQAAPTIALVNPSAYGTRMIMSDRQDVDQRYRLVASVSNPPPAPIVEFDLARGFGNPVTVEARRVSANVWEALIPIEPFLAPLLDGECNNDLDPLGILCGEITVTARLFSGSAVVDEDAVAAQIYDLVSTEDLPESLPETVEILYPANGGPLGFFDPPGPARAGFVIEATTSSFAPNQVLPANLSQLGRVHFYYSTAPYGTTPAWRECATSVVTSSLFVRAGCELAAGDSLTDVTAVAAIANDSWPTTLPELRDPLLGRDQSGDAHGVHPYVQVPVSLTVSASSQTAIADNGSTCASFTAELLDQLGRGIWRGNLDVHASGPNDGLTLSNTLSAPQGHSIEQAWNCSGSGSFGFAGTQGDHNIPGAPDIKHQEGSTNTLGRLTIPSYSRSVGRTDFVVWYDGDDSDTMEAVEMSAGAAVEWAAGPPPTPEPSDTASPQPTQTQPGPQPTQSQPGASPTQGSPSPTSSPSPAASPTPRLVGRQVSAEATAQRIRFGQSFTLSGRVAAEQGAPPGCTSAVEVQILADRIGDRDGFEQIGTVTSDAQGNFSASIRPEASANYAARVAATALCDEATSPTEPVLVKKVVRLRAAKPSVKRGNRVKLTAQVFPCQGHVGDVVALQRLGGNGRFGQIKTGKLNRNCRVAFTPRVPKDSVFRAKAPKTDPDHLGAKSNRVRVRARR